MDKHKTVLGALFLGLGVMGLIGTFIVLVIFSLGSAAVGAAALHDPEVPFLATLLPAGLGLFIGFMIAVTSIPCLIAGYGLLARKSWGILAGLIVGILSLPHFPMGTAVGIYAIWIYLQPGSSTDGNGVPARL